MLMAIQRLRARFDGLTCYVRGYNMHVLGCFAVGFAVFVTMSFAHAQAGSDRLDGAV